MDDDDYCEHCQEPFEASTVPELRRGDTCGDCIEFGADALYDSWKDSRYD